MGKTMENGHRERSHVDGEFRICEGLRVIVAQPADSNIAGLLNSSTSLGSPATGFCGEAFNSVESLLSLSRFGALSVSELIIVPVNRRGSMRREPQARRMGDPFGLFGGPEWSSFTLGRDPFDDPFFTGRFQSMFPSSYSVAEGDSSSQLLPSPRKPLIQELNSDDDDMDVEDLDGDGAGEPKRRSSGFDKEPFVDHPDDDDVNLEKKHVNEKKNNKADTTRSDSVKYRYCKVTYGGVDGAFYASTSTQRMGADGSLMEECKEADKTTGQATHRISRGIKDKNIACTYSLHMISNAKHSIKIDRHVVYHEEDYCPEFVVDFSVKGHSLTRKLKADGKVETMQTLHNLQEDDLTNFNEAWKGSTEKHMPTWDLFSTLGNTGAPKGGGTAGVRNEEMDRPAGRAKKTIRINIE
ncbi:hypothetical protein AKJ16_DCAP24411 [Drosera capensis]